MSWLDSGRQMLSIGKVQPKRRDRPERGLPQRRRRQMKGVIYRGTKLNLMIPLGTITKLIPGYSLRKPSLMDLFDFEPIP